MILSVELAPVSCNSAALIDWGLPGTLISFSAVKLIVLVLLALANSASPESYDQKLWMKTRQ